MDWNGLDWNGKDYAFDGTREHTFITGIIEAVTNLDIDAFSAACAEFNKIKKVKYRLGFRVWSNTRHFGTNTQKNIRKSTFFTYVGT